MRLMSRFRLRLRSLFFRGRMEEELDEELRYHLDREMEEGMTELRSIVDMEQKERGVSRYAA